MEISQDVQDSPFASGMFAFLIGPEHVRFHIHSGILEQLSQPLSTLMNNGSMKESNEKVSEHQDIDVNTFARFAEYCYSKNYRTTPKDSSSDEDMEHKIPRTNKANCHNCGIYYLISSKKNTSYCSQCSRYYSQTSPASLALPITFKKQKYGSTSYTHDQIRTFLDNQMPKDEATAHLTEHAKVYVLADRYLVPSLKALAIHKLHRDLVEYDVSIHGAGEVAELLQYTYANTPGIDDAEGTDNELRELVGTYAACKAKDLLKDKAFRAMLEEGGEAASGFACVLAQRLG